jgi:hypothetical protein
VPAVTFQAELAFEGVVDRFDDLAQRFEDLRAGPSWLAVAARAQQVQPGLGQGSLEVAAVVVLVADQRLAGQQGGQLGVADDGQQYLPLVGPWRRPARTRRQSVQGAQQVQPQPPEPAGAGGAVPVLGVSGQVGAADGVRGPAALDLWGARSMRGL